MKKLLKKITVVVSLGAMMTMSLAACSKKAECEVCGETKKCKKVTVEIEGYEESGYVCNDCYSKFKAEAEAQGFTVK